MLRRNHKIPSQRVHAHQPRDIEQDPGPHDRRDGLRRMLLHAARVGLLRREAAVQFPVTGKMRQRIDVRPHVPAQRQHLRSRTGAVVQHEIPMLLRQRARERRMRRKMRHAGKQRLPKIIDSGKFHEDAFRERFREAGDSTAVFPLHRPSLYSRP